MVQYPSLSPAYSAAQRLDALCRTCPDDARFDWIHALQLLLELQQTLLRSTTRSSPCVKPSSCCETDFLHCTPARGPSFRDALASLVSSCLMHLWYRTCSSSTIRFFLDPSLSSLLLATPPARASEPWHGTTHRKRQHASVRTLDCDSQQWI